MKTAAIFPGQGSEYPGMLDRISGDGVSARVFGRIEEITGRNVAEAAHGNGRPHGLGDHLNAQLAVFGTSACYWSLLRGSETFDFVAGHSLGFYAAVYASGALCFDDCVRLIAEVQSSIEAVGSGLMASVMGLSEPVVEEICRGSGDVFVSNVNSATQIVISGAADAVWRAGSLALSRGALTVKELPIDHPLHSPLMRGIEERLGPIVRSLAVRKPAIPLVSHLDGRLLDDAGIRAVLTSQLLQKVAWRDTVRSLAGFGVQRFFEVGPADTLSKLVRWIERGAEALKAEEVLGCRAA